MQEKMKKPKKKENRLLHTVTTLVATTWWGGPIYKTERYTLKINKKGELVLGDLVD